jgi:subtilase family serine protease
MTEGNNSYNPAGVKGYSAGPGWDAVTGLGTPNAEKLLPDLIAALK